MVATFIPIGEPASEAERQALRFLVEGLPSTFTVYGNPWLVERSGVIYELDAVVVGPHAIFVVEIKSYRGRIEGTDNDWWLPEKIRSPLKTNRHTAQILKTHLRGASYLAGQVWTEGFVFLSATTDVGVRGPASNDRVHTRRTILSALQDTTLLERLSRGRAQTTTDAERELLSLFTGLAGGPKPLRRVREYEVIGTGEHHEGFMELYGRNTLSGAERLLRVTTFPPLADAKQQARITERARWEAQVLGRLGRVEGILAADPPFNDDAGIVLPFERFAGVTLTTWLEHFGPGVREKDRAPQRTRTDLWLRLAEALDQTHAQGVVHRLLRPEVVLIEDLREPKELRVTGFDLAKQLASEGTISLTTLADERLVFSAPEVITAWSSAEPASDQFSLGALLALLLTGKPLFESSRALMAEPRLLRRVRDMAGGISLRLDDAVARMVARRPTDRFPSLAEAIAAVRAARENEGQTALPLVPTRSALDAENLPAGARVGTDYEIVGPLGQGGMAVVYAARHLVSGRTRALKVARPNHAAEDALRGEYQVLSALDHPNVVRVIDLSQMLEGRLTLVMERVGTCTLRQWLAAHPNPEPPAQRRLAEDLLAGLDYLEQKGVTHKDLKPDNLLVGDGRLTIIDFSLATMAEDALYGGTALYRDPASVRFSHGTDRYAAALCLFELYAGRHAFDGRAPEPGQDPLVGHDDIEPAGLVELFAKALSPVAESRYPSARALRDALLVALGDGAREAPAGAPSVSAFDPSTPLRLTGLSNRARSALGRSNIHTVGELSALTETQLRGLHAVGTKTAAELLTFHGALLGRGFGATARASDSREPPLVPDLTTCPESVEKLPLSDALRSALAEARLPTIGAVASLGRSELLGIRGIGRRKLADVVEALHRYRDRSEGADPRAHTLDGLWNLAARPLSDAQRTAVERCLGVLGEPEGQQTIAESLGKSQPQISQDLSKGLERLDIGVLGEVREALESVLDGMGGIARIDALGERLEEQWPAGDVESAGLVRLLARKSSGRMHVVEVDGAGHELVARTDFDKETLRAFAAEVHELASGWPPVEPETARHRLAALLHPFDGDPLALGVRVAEHVHVAETGHLYVAPLDARHSLGFVLERVRDNLSRDELRAEVRRIFGEETPFPEPDHLLSVVAQLGYRVVDDRIVPGRAESLTAPPPLVPDAAAAAFGQRSPAEIVGDMLANAADSRGFRMVVAPPERHREVARSVAKALGATWLSFDDAFFSEHALDLPRLERAERFQAQRDALTEAAEQTLFRLLDEHGSPGRRLVLGDTGLWGLCDALDLPRRLYDETLTGSRGFWVLVVPGVIHKNQPRWNEGPPLWHLEGATVQLGRELGT